MLKKITVLVLFALVFSNCSANDEMGTIVEQIENEDNNINETIFAMGDFIDGTHPTSGKATVNSDKTTLIFTNFKTDIGPKLLVYLSTDTNSTEYVNLGDLKGVSGDFTYSIPANTDLSKYKLVNIWCVDFSVSFGTAELK
ncbi:DM13 domain-containing protein [Lutibacter sp.]|uniref:DM13 domain-containing protein n=1 Tax=Lutibacter sp. TaxID=1925666 RepID=UPI00349FF43E